jgi:hypothetical protein
MPQQRFENWQPRIQARNFPLSEEMLDHVGSGACGFVISNIGILD